MSSAQDRLKQIYERRTPKLRPIQDTPAWERRDPGDDFVAYGEEIEQYSKSFGPSYAFGLLNDWLSAGEYWSVGMTKELMSSGKPSLQRLADEVQDPRVSYADIADQMYPEWSKWKRFALGFGMSMALDPATYTPAGIVTVPLKAGKKAVKGTKLGAKAIKSFGESIFAKAFIPGAGLPESYYLYKTHAKHAFEAKQMAIKDSVEDIFSGLTKADREALTYYREHPKELAGLPQHLKISLDKMGKKLDDLIDDAHKSGLITDAERHIWEGRRGVYIQHFFPGRGVPPLTGGMLPADMFAKMRKPSWMKERVFESAEDARLLAKDFEAVMGAKTIPEARKIASERGVADEFGVFAGADLEQIQKHAKSCRDWWMPELDSAKLYYYRLLDQEAYKQERLFSENTLDLFGYRLPDGTKMAPTEDIGLYYPQGHLRIYARDVLSEAEIAQLVEKHGEMIPAEVLADTLESFPGVTKRVPVYALPKAIAKDMNQPAKMFTSRDPASNWAVKVWDRATNTWKGMATTLRMPFHIRNWYSNMFQANLGGLNNPKRFTDAARFQANKIAPFGKLKLGKNTYTYDQLKGMIDTLGIHGRGWIGADVQVSIAREIESILKYGKVRNLNPMRWGRASGAAIEDNARIALFFDQLAKGSDPFAAAKHVRKYLFDYSELTPFEKGTMRRIFPFYTWTRKNFVLQMENLIANPRKYQAWVKGQRAFSEPETAEELRLKPEYFDDMLYMKSPWKTDQDKPLYMSVDLPPMELIRLWSTKEFLYGSLHPAKFFMELYHKTKGFPSPRPIAQNDLDMAPAPFWVAWMPDQLLKAMASHNIVDGIEDEFGHKIMGINKLWLHAIQSTLPFLNEMSRMYDTPIALDDERPEIRRKSYLTGMGWKGLDVPNEEMREAFGLKDYQKNLQHFIRQRGRLPYGDEDLILQDR